MTSTSKVTSLVDASVGGIMRKDVRTVEGTRPLLESVKSMRDADIGCIIVLENGKPVGIFTERDLVRKVAEGADILKVTTAQVMSRPLTTISSTASLWDAITLMGRQKIRRLPVIENGKLIGILTERDLFRLILSQQSLLLESVSESLPLAAREQLKGITGALGIEKPPARVQDEEA